MKLHQIGIQAGIGLMALMSQGAQAADKQLLDILLANGAISQEQHDRLLKKEEPLTRDDVEVSLKDGLKFETQDGDFEMKIGGRLHAQAAYHSKDNVAGQKVSDGVEIRRARLRVRGVMFKDWKYQAQYDFAGNEVGIKDLWLAYTGLDWLPFIGIGHQKQPYSLEVEMSSNDIPFVERSLDTEVLQNALIDRAIGLRAQSHGSHWFAAGGVYGQSIDSPDNGDEGWGTVGRFVLAPVHNDQQVLHLGVRGAYRVPEDQNRTVRFRAETTHQSDLFLVDTGDILNVDHSTLAGGEAVAVYGPFSLGGEYTHMFVNRKGDNSDDLDFDGFHAQATWSLTGESRASIYDQEDGEFKRLTPDHNFSLSRGGWGAWELAARYGWVDLNDGNIQGGKASDFTVALNWYVNPHIRFMLDYTRVLDTNHALGVDFNSQADREAEDLNIVEMRGQLTF
ncbi:MAG: porin [Methylothermaceae bacterium]|nr:porin [Methylothermaceae bacterium]